MTEEWKELKIYNGIDYSGLYMISNLGNVKSLGREVEVQSSNQVQKFTCTRKYPEKMLKKVLDSYGYHHVALCKNGRCMSSKVHRLVAYLFIPNPNNEETVNHKDFNKTNNSIDNLEWLSTTANNQHAIMHGVNNSPGHNKKKLKISKDALYYIFNSTREASEFIGCSSHSVSQVARETHRSIYGWKVEYL